MSAERCQSLILRLLDFSCEPEFSGQMEIARELFAIATGKVNDEDPFYENRMRVFQESFVFDFRLSDVASGSTIFELFLQRGQALLSAAELAEYEQLRSVRRSLFKVVKPVRDGVLVTDLFSKRNSFVLPLPEYLLTGFDPGRIFEARAVNFGNVNFFTGSFVFHRDEARSIIERHVRDFLFRRTFECPEQVADWRSELKRRHELLHAVAEQKKVLESGEKRKSIEVLVVNRNLAAVAQELSGAGFVMTLGNPDAVSPFVPETPFYDTGALMDALAFSELRCFRYRHIVPEKLYAFEKREFPLSQPSRVATLLPQERGA